MSNYQKGKIYKLVSNHTTNIYYGSTISKLAKRKGQHKADYNKWKNGERTKITSFDLYELGDVDIVLVESYSCKSKDELHARERYYIENNECVNKIIPGRTKKEYCLDNKEKVKGWEKNRRVRDKDKRYKQARKKITCECGVECSLRNKARHINSPKHQKYLKKNILI